MLRSIYIWLLWRHPAPFRQRFGDEMLEIYDNAAVSPGAGMRLIVDGILSLVRQRILRREFHRRQPAAAGAFFQMVAPQRFRPWAFVQGGLLSVALLFGIGATIGKGGHVRALLVGSHQPSPHLLPVARASVAETALDSTVRFGEGKQEDPWRKLAEPYFKIIRVLTALDADQDLRLSAWEIFTAPAALRKLDLNRDGLLSAEECGFSLGVSPLTLPPDFVAAARLTFMRANPVLATLDTDHDGVISASEIMASPVCLKTLDRNGDGILTPGELMPDRVAKEEK